MDSTQTQKCSAVCEYYFYNHNTDSVIPAIPKSAGFTGMLARLAKPSLLHSKQWFTVMLFILYIFLVVPMLILCTDSEQLAGATKFSSLSRTEISFLYSG